MDRSPSDSPELQASTPQDSHSERLLARLFSQQPKDIGIIHGTKRDVRGYLSNKPELIPDRVYPHTDLALSALLAPKSEWPIVRSSKRAGVGCDQKRVRDPATQPRVYGIRNLFPLIANLLRPDSVHGDHDMVNLNLGMGTDVGGGREVPSPLSISPALPGYAVLGIERLKELKNISNRVRLRIFSTGSLNAVVNHKDPLAIRETQRLQKELLDAFIAQFYPELLGDIDTTDMVTDIPIVGRREYLAARDKLLPRLQPLILKSLEKSAEKYGGPSSRIEDAIRYAVYHTLPTTFRDGALEKYQVTVGGYSEDPFMAIRGFNEPDAQCRVGVVVRGILAKTPAYLHRPTQVYKSGGKDVSVAEITMAEFLDPDNDRVNRFTESHHSERSTFSRDLVHVGRSVAGVGNEEEGIMKLRRFYQDLYK